MRERLNKIDELVSKGLVDSRQHSKFLGNYEIVRNDLNHAIAHAREGRYEVASRDLEEAGEHFGQLMGEVARGALSKHYAPIVIRLGNQISKTFTYAMRLEGSKERRAA